MTTSPAVSVIIPMYNAEKYIAECLESIFIQTFKDYEVIVVDDCSTDNSCAVVESYVEKFDGRLKLLHTEENSGSGAMPRNRGLMLSRGEYVFFADADDLLTQTALEELFSLTKNFDADVIYCEKYYVANSNLSEIYIYGEQQGNYVDKPTFESEHLSERVLAILDRRFWITPWCKFIKRDLIVENEIFFPYCKISEDDIWTYKLILRAKKILRVPNVVYVWRRTKKSMTGTQRTPQQEVVFWLNPMILGLKDFDDFMSRMEFFKKNPDYKLAILDHLANGRCFSQVSRYGEKLLPFEIFETIINGFRNNLGDKDVLIAYLCTLIHEQRKTLKLKDEQIKNLSAQIL